ncbi:interactor of constitutive active ROPs-like protein [Trifolium pratense]|uniref:Interactor of constitutive active ROPs-like protein n=1 Tax=Trifolium pratense TaxID=57577 RepID=A0A2K3NST4_TRIPR|nr:interactor of constitutive active ROPs-like protein [Trifolium pratense]
MKERDSIAVPQKLELPRRHSTFLTFLQNNSLSSSSVKFLSSYNFTHNWIPSFFFGGVSGVGFYGVSLKEGIICDYYCRKCGSGALNNRKNGTSGVPRKKSPSNPRTARKMKTSGSDSNSVSSSPNPASKTPKDRSPNVKPTQSPISEKSGTNRVQELESRLSQLEEDLKKAKEQLNSSESLKIKVQKEAEDANNKLLSMSRQLEESQQQLLELSNSEDGRIQELRKISQDRDREWKSELEAVRKQHSMDLSALASAMNDIQKLKMQLERARKSEATQIDNAESAEAEIQDLRVELDETLSLIAKLKNEVSHCKKSESQALEIVAKTQMQLETSNKMVESLQLEGMNASQAYRNSTLELENSRSQVKSLEELVSKLQDDLVSEAGLSPRLPAVEVVESEEINRLKAELVSVKAEAGKLKSALDVAEVSYQDEYIRSTMQIRSAFEQLENTKSESIQRQAELYEELKKAKADIEELRGRLMNKESQLQDDDVAELKARLYDRETKLQNVTEENNTLNKMEIKKEELEKNKITDEAVASAEAARAANQEALTKLGYINKEVDESNRKIARVTEELDAAQASNSELEAELRRLKVQSDQWRKAAEAAAAMISSGNNGKIVERTGLIESGYNNSIPGNKMSSPYSEDTDDDSPKKKNTTMLKKIGVLWKKNHQ